MVRVNMFETAEPGIYGTATWEDIATVCGVATLFLRCGGRHSLWGCTTSNGLK